MDYLRRCRRKRVNSSDDSTTSLDSEKKLKGQLRDKRSARLGRSHRIIYTARNGDLVVLTIGAGKDIYR